MTSENRAENSHHSSADLITLAETHGGKVILAGDTSQLQAVSNGTDQPDFYFGVIHDRPRITTAARCLLRQLGPQPPIG